MKYIFVDESWEDYLYWQKNNKKYVKKINELLKDISRQPFTGKGKPEPLKYGLKGYWSRRIDRPNRIVYKVENNNLWLIQLRYHY